MRAPSSSEVPVSCEKGNVGSGNEIVNQPNDENNETRHAPILDSPQAFRDLHSLRTAQ